MPNRTPLTPISGNRIAQKELSPHLRGIIIGRSQAGKNPTQIADALNLPQSTVRDTLDKSATRSEGKTIQRSGRPRKLTIREERYILRAVRQLPKITYQALENKLNFRVSRGTYYHILKRHHIKNWLAKKRPHLTPMHAKNRLAWALARKDWSCEEWSKILFRDECTVERGKENSENGAFGLLNRPGNT